MTTNLIRSVGKYFRAIKSTPLFHYSSVSIPVKVVLLWPLHYYLLVIPLIHGIKEMCSICSVCLLVEKGLSNIILFWWFLHQIISVMWYLTVFYVVKRLLCFILSSPFLPSPLLSPTPLLSCFPFSRPFIIQYTFRSNSQCRLDTSLLISPTTFVAFILFFFICLRNNLEDGWEKMALKCHI